MRTITIQIGKLFEFIKEKYNKTFEKDKFVEAPFPIDIKDEKGEWKPVTELVVKTDDVYETKFDNGVSIKTAADHMVCFYPEKDLHKYTKDIQVGDKLEYINATVVSNEKILENQDVYGLQIDTPTHLYTDTYGIIHHNTHSVCQALKDNWGKSPLRQKGFKLVEVKGTLGESMSPLISFFYVNRNKKLIILDDCDSFLINTNQSIKNFCKAILDSDNAVVRYSPTYNKGATLGVNAEIRGGRYNVLEEEPEYVDNLLSPDYIDPNYDPNYQYNPKKESCIKFRIGTKRLKENILDVYINDKFVGSEKISDADRKLYERGMVNKILRESEDDEEYDEADEEYVKEMQMAGGGELTGPDAGELESIPVTFEFHSRVIFISNLTVAQINSANSAVTSRCQTVEIHLTPAEFLVRMGSILDNFDISKHTYIPKDLITDVKNEVFKLFSIAVNLFLGGKQIFGTTVKINRQLQFRMVSDLASKWIMTADTYCARNNIELTHETFPEIAQAIEKKFFLYKVMNYLEGGV